MKPRHNVFGHAVVGAMVGATLNTCISFFRYFVVMLIPQARFLSLVISVPHFHYIFPVTFFLLV